MPLGWLGLRLVKMYSWRLLFQVSFRIHVAVGKSPSVFFLSVGLTSEAAPDLFVTLLLITKASVSDLRGGLSGH